MLFQYDHITGILQDDMNVTLIDRDVKRLYPNSNIVDCDGGFGFMDAAGGYTHRRHQFTIIIDFFAQSLTKRFMVGYPRIYDKN